MDRPARKRLQTEERRGEILRAARERYAQGTFTEVTAADIAEAAGASQALVFHYFDTKAGLYAAVVRDAVERLAQAQRRAVAAVPEGAPVRDRVRASLLVYLDHIASHARAWAFPLVGGVEPPEAIEIRRTARAGYVDALRALIGESDWARHEYAFWGYFGFLDQACLRWTERGCPNAERDALIDAALGSLEGALGDWAVTPRSP